MKRKRNILGNPATTYYSTQSAERAGYLALHVKRKLQQKEVSGHVQPQKRHSGHDERRPTRGEVTALPLTHTVIFIKSRFDIVIGMRFAHLSSFPWLESSVSRMMDKEVKPEREMEECGLKFGFPWLWERLFSGSARHAAIETGTYMHAFLLSLISTGLLSIKYFFFLFSFS